MSSETRKQIALSILAGVLYFVGFVGFDVWPLEWICFVPILHAIRGVGARRALLLGTIFGLVTNLGGYYWVIHLLHEFADLHVLLSALGWFLLSLYQGLLLALVIVCVRYARESLQIAPVWSLPVAFCALELMFPLLFPSYIGNSQYQLTALTQIVDVTGMLGLTALIALVNGAAYEVFEAARDRRRVVVVRVAAVVMTMMTVLIYGKARLQAIDAKTAAAETIRVAIVQTNLGARDKAEQSSEFIRRHQTMSKQAIEANPEIDLIVWPESAYNRWIERSERNLARATGALGRPVIFGALTWGEQSPGEREIFNTAILTSSVSDVLGMFDKVQLLAFGETIPLIETFPQIRTWFPRSSTFTRGKTLRHFRLPQVSLLPMICYEDILPAFVREMWHSDGPADALVNVTNDSWYGDTHEPLIHLVLASFRTIETRRALIRSTNTGISAVVDPAGRIVGRTGQWTQETLIADVPLIKDGSSTIYMRYGDVFGWAAVALLAAGVTAVIVRSRRERRNTR